MAKINLLPWREELRKQQNQEFGIVVAIVAAVAVAIVFGGTVYYDKLIENQESRNKFMQSEIAKLDEKIKEIKKLEEEKTRLLNRINTIQQLQSNRTEIVHLFDEVVKNTPDGIYLKSMKQEGSGLILSGVAESNARVSELVANIEGSQWMKLPRIDVIKRNTKDVLQSNDFTVRMKQARPKTGKEEGEEG